MLADCLMTTCFYSHARSVSSWDSPDPNGVPYTHHTFTWRDPSPPGDYFIRVKAVDKDGQEGWSKNEEYTILPREE